MSLRRRASDERGQMMVVLTLALVVILGMAGILVDSGLVAIARREAQAAADLGALAAAHAAASGTTGNAAIAAAAQDVATANGFPASYTDCSGVSRSDGFEVRRPPTSGTYAGNNGYVEIIVRRPMATRFLAFVGPDCVLESARAVAKIGSGGSNLTALGNQPLHIRVTHTNSDDINTYFQLFSELQLNGTLIASGQLDCLKGIPNWGAPKAADAQIPWLDTHGLPAQLRTGDVLALKVSVRTAQCSVHRDGSFAMWYDTSNAFYQSYFTMTISGQARAIYLRSNGSGSCGASGTPGVSSLFLSTVPWVSGAAKCVRKYPPRYGNPPVILGGNTGSPPPTLWTMTITEFGEIQPDPILPSQLVE